MGRRSSSGGRATRRSAPRPAATTPSKSDNRAPPPASHAPTAAPVQSGFGGMLAEGLAWGTGNAIAHRAVEAVVGPRTIRTEVAAAPAQAASSMAGSDPCSTHNKAFQDCLNSSGSDISQCQFYMDMLVACRRNPGSMM